MEPENCGSVEDFLLSPWVLIQLPFRPALYHQWTLALLAETLKYQMDISDLMIIETPLTLHPTLVRLKIMSSVLYSNAQFHLENYMKCIAYKWKIEPNNTMMSTFAELIPTLKFVLSAECKAIVKALKRLAWSDRAAKCGPMFGLRDTMRMQDPLHFYNMSFWECRFPYFNLFGYGGQASNLTWQYVFDQNTSVYANINVLKRLVDEKIVNAGRLGGVSRDEILAAVDAGCSTLFKIYYHYEYYFCKYFRL